MNTSLILRVLLVSVLSLLTVPAASIGQTNDSHRSGLSTAQSKRNPALAEAAAAQYNPGLQAVAAQHRQQGSFDVRFSRASSLRLDELAGTRFDPAEENRKLSRKPMRPVVASVASFPAVYDPRKDARFPLVQDQGECGSCWIFGAIAAYEVNYTYPKRFGPSLDPSEQYLLRRLFEDTNRQLSCRGGWPSDVADYMTKDGTVTRTEAKYTGRDTDTLPSHLKGLKPKTFRVKDWGYLNPTAVGSVPQVNVIKEAIQKYGAVVCAVNATSSWQVYGGSVFKLNEGGQVNHAVAIVGWDEQYIEPATGSKTPHWIVKNSWGDDWGENGYIRIKYGSNQIGFGALWIDSDADINPNPNPTPIPPPTPTPTSDYIDFYHDHVNLGIERTFVRVVNAANQKGRFSIKVMSGGTAHEYVHDIAPLGVVTVSSSEFLHPTDQVKKDVEGQAKLVAVTKDVVITGEVIWRTKMGQLVLRNTVTPQAVRKDWDQLTEQEKDTFFLRLGKGD
jgi:C1A family cysteine protease